MFKLVLVEMFQKEQEHKLHKLVQNQLVLKMLDKLVRKVLLNQRETLK